MTDLAPLLNAFNGWKRRSEPMSRRFSMYGIALICSVCIVVLFVSHRLTNSTLEQAWPNGDMDNTTEDIAEVVNAQRLDIAKEMNGYRYPNGRYNMTARSLYDLVPEMGGSPIRNIIITTWRSGSTFLGDVLNSHPANYYHYEPLLDFDIVQIRDKPLADEALQALRGLLMCEYSDKDHYLDYGKNHIFLFTHNTRLWDKCLAHPNICWQPEFLTPFCRLFPFQSMKVVRLRLRLVEELLADPRLNVRVVYLVRDPRGTLQSRKHREWCPGNPDCILPNRLCTDLLDDHSAAKRLSVVYPNRFRAVRYEDLSIEPFTGVQELFQFFGLDFHDKVQKFLDTHTKVNAGGVSSTYRNSKSAPFHWRRDLTHSEVRVIQRSCVPAMNLWGYVPTFNSTHQREFNPLGDFKL